MVLESLAVGSERIASSESFGARVTIYANDCDCRHENDTYICTYMKGPSFLRGFATDVRLILVAQLNSGYSLPLTFLFQQIGSI